MQLHPTMDRFYLSIIDFAGMKVENNVFVNKDERIGPMTIDGRHLAMPYFDILKNPDNRLIFHPLNENYTQPETTQFNLFKKRLVLELNLRLSALLTSLIGVAGDVTLQQRIKSSKLIGLVSNIGEVEMPLVESLLAASTASKKVNNEAFLFDIFLKKNGEINDTPYAAIGKINFTMFNEINRSLAEDEKTYKVFGKTLSKKHLMMLDNVFRVVFPGIDNPLNFTEGTDNKVFRYLNILLKTSYQIAHRMNEIADMLDELNEPQLKLEEIRSNLDWKNELEELYGMSGEIRLIPNQTDLGLESSKMKLDESKAAHAHPASAPAPVQHAPVAAPAFDPSRAAPQQAAPMMQAPVQQVQQVQAPSPEDIIRGTMGGGGMAGMMPGMAAPGVMPGMMIPSVMQPQMQVPSWILQEQMRTGQVQTPQMQMPQMQMPMMQAPQMQMQMPQMMPGMQMMQPQQQQIVHTPQGPMIVTPQGMVPAQLMGQNGMMQEQPMQQGLAINPHFMGRTAAPFN